MGLFAHLAFGTTTSSLNVGRWTVFVRHLAPSKLRKMNAQRIEYRCIENRRTAGLAWLDESRIAASKCFLNKIWWFWGRLKTKGDQIHGFGTMHNPRNELALVLYLALQSTPLQYTCHNHARVRSACTDSSPADMIANVWK